MPGKAMKNQPKQFALLQVPYFDVKRQYEKLSSEFEAAFQDVAGSGQYILSSRVQDFEKNFAQYCGAAHGLGVASGTDALVLSLKALGIGKGDEVILPSFTFAATAFAVIHVQAQPVFAEVDEKTYTIDPSSVEKKISRRTKAILPVHLYGQAAEMKALGTLASKRKLKIVEDACQSHGAEYYGKKTGSFGDAGCFSFYPTKNLGAMGDGGMITTSHASVLDKAMVLRNLGRKNVNDLQTEVGYTSRLDAVQAAMLQIKLLHLDEFNDNRRRVAQLYKSLLQATPLLLPAEGEGRRHVYHLFVVRVPNGKRDALREALSKNGIPSMIHYPVPVHRLPACKPYVPKGTQLKLTDRLCSEILSLPIFPEMTAEEVEKVSAVIRNFYK